MVDVEIIDAKNGQGSILVSADPEMCSCGPDGRKARVLPPRNDPAAVAAANPHAALPWRMAAPKGRCINTPLIGGRGVSTPAPPSQAALMAALRPSMSAAMHRTGVNGLPRPASAGDIAALGAGLSQREGGGLAAPTTSKNSGGSELFDALLMAATGNAAGAAGGGDGTPGGAGAAAGSPGGGEQQVSIRQEGLS